MSLLFQTIIIFLFAMDLSAQSINLLTNVENRQKQSLNGQWKIIIDPYETGYYNYRYQPRTDRYFENRKQKDKSELVEYNFDNSEELTVPGRQDMYNRKGLLSDKGEKKQAFYVLQNFYREKIK